MAGNGYLAICQVPSLFRIPYINSGYRRVGQPWHSYLRSLLGLHNEAGNVWTHLLGALLMAVELWRFRRDFAASAPFDTAMATLFGIISVILHLVSASAHLMHSHSAKTHLVVCCCDYAGIGVDGFAYNVIGYCFYSMPTYYSAVRPIIVPVSCILSFFLSAALAYALASRRRDFSWKVLALMLTPAVLFFILGLGPVWHKVYVRLVYRGTPVEFQWHHLIHPTLLAMSLFFFVSRIPERWNPGRFDLVGHSHQFFHVGVTLSQWAVLRGVRVDLESGRSILCSQRDQQFSLSILWLTELLLVGLNFAFIAFLYRKYHQKSQKDTKDED